MRQQELPGRRPATWERARRAIAILGATLALAFALPAAAQPGPGDDLAARAAERKKDGDQAMEALRYEDALQAYGDAYAITKDTALLYNRGRALQALSRFPEALDTLESFDAQASAELKARVPRLPKLIEELRARVSTVTIHANVDGARVVVREKIVGKSPLPGPLRLTAGPADVELEADGYFPAKKHVELPGGGAITVDLELFSRDSSGVLAVTASTQGAVVTVDGKKIGVAPVETNVAKGTHTVVVRHPDFRLFETSVVVTPGGTKRVAADLQSASVVTRWWFWGGVGVAVAAGVAITIAAVSERSPDTGTIPPGQLKPARGAALFRF